MSQMYDEKPKQGGGPNIVLIIVGVLGALVLCAVVVVVILALLGPSIGNVFSNVIEGLSTPSQ